MSQQKESLIKGVLHYSISSWVNIIVGFVSVIVTTRIIVPEANGAISFFISASSFLMYILTFGMDGAFIRFYNEPPSGSSKNQVLYRIIIYSSLICLVLGFLFIGPFYKAVSSYIFEKESRLLVIMLVLHTYSQAVFRFLNISFRMGFKTRQYTIQNILINCFTRVVIIVSALLTKSVDVILTSVGISLFVLLLFYIIVQRKEVVPIDQTGTVDYSISLRGYKDFLKFSLYSAPSYFVTYFNGFMSQGIITSNMGLYSLGIFSSCGMFKTIFSALQGGFSTYWSAYVYKNHDTDRERISLMHDYALLFAMICASGLVVFRDIVYLVIGEQYHGSKVFFSLLLISAVLGFLRETTDKGLAIARKNEITLIANIASVIINLVGCFILSRLLGLIGAALADAFSAIFLYVIITVYGQKYYKTINNPIKSIIVTCLIVSIMVFPCLSYSILSIAIVTIVLDIIIILLMRKEVRSLLVVIIGFIKKGG